MDHFEFNKALTDGNVEWRRHAIERLLSRGYRRTEILEGLQQALILEEYPMDNPYPSALFFGFSAGRVFHAVVAFDGKKVYIITVYEPDRDHFESDLRTRIKP